MAFSSYDDRETIPAGRPGRHADAAAAANGVRLEAHMLIATDKLHPDEAPRDFARWRIEEKPFALAVAALKGLLGRAYIANRA